MDPPNGPHQQGKVTSNLTFFGFYAGNLPTCHNLFGCFKAGICLGYAIAIGIKDSGIYCPGRIPHDHMATAADYRVDGMPRVRALCALTGELIYEPTHPWLEQVRCHLLKMDLDQQRGILPDCIDHVLPTF